MPSVGDQENYPGTLLSDLAEMEQFFNVDIYVYQSTIDGKQSKLVYLPSGLAQSQGKEPLHLIYFSPMEM